MSQSSIPAQETADRLRMLRERVYGENITQFVKRIGLPYHQYLNMEIGRPLTRDVAIAIVRRCPGLTLDWLFFGERRGLTYDLVVKLYDGERSR